MTTVYGLTSAGFVVKPLAVIRQDLQDALRNAFGLSIDVGDKSAFGQIVGIWSERLFLLWELAQAVNGGQDPDQATGSALDGLSALTGTFRPPASSSTVTLTLTGTPTTIVAQGSVAAATSTGQQFALDSAATIVAVASWTAGHAYVLLDRVVLGGRVYQCSTAGTSAGSGGPTGTTTGIADNTCTWDFLGSGTGAVDASATATATGPITGFARDITTIVNAVVGWDGVINVLDANPGRDVATDEELRTLREQELAASGSTPADAIRANILQIDGVIACTVFVNNTDAVVDSMPPHSVEVMVRTAWSPGPLDQIIYDTLLVSVAAGIATTGNTTGTAVDSQGTSYSISFSRPDEILVYVAIAVTYDASTYPTAGNAQVKDAIVAWGDLQSTGKDAVSSAIGAKAFAIDGVDDVTHTYIDVAPSPTVPTTIAIGLREIAVYDTSRITVTSTPGTP